MSEQENDKAAPDATVNVNPLAEEVKINEKQETVETPAVGVEL